MRMHLPCTTHGHPHSGILSQGLHHMIKGHSLGDVEAPFHGIGVPRCVDGMVPLCPTDAARSLA